MANTAKAKDPIRCDRLRLSTETKRRLWAESGGYCQRPECPNYLFSDESGVDFAEMAHIVAATTGELSGSFARVEGPIAPWCVLLSACRVDPVFERRRHAPSPPWRRCTASSAEAHQLLGRVKPS